MIYYVNWNIYVTITIFSSISDKLMYISNDVTQNYPFCRLKLVVEMFESST